MCAISSVFHFHLNLLHVEGFLLVLYERVSELEKLIFFFFCECFWILERLNIRFILPKKSLITCKTPGTKSILLLGNKLLDWLDTPVFLSKELIRGSFLVVVFPVGNSHISVENILASCQVVGYSSILHPAWDCWERVEFGRMLWVCSLFRAASTTQRTDFLAAFKFFHHELKYGLVEIDDKFLLFALLLVIDEGRHRLNLIYNFANDITQDEPWCLNSSQYVITLFVDESRIDGVLDVVEISKAECFKVFSLLNLLFSLLHPLLYNLFHCFFVFLCRLRDGLLQFIQQ